MKIVLVCPYAWDLVGGVQSHVRALTEILRGREHDVTVLAPRRRAATVADGGVRLLGRAAGIPANGSVAPVAFGPVVAADVRRALRDLAPDVVHVHEPLIPSLSLLALRSSEAPTLGTFHAAADSSLGYHVAKPLLEKAIARLSIRTAVSDDARSLVARYFPGEYVITPNGIDVARFAGGRAVDLGPGPNILFLSRLERRKGLHVLIRAFTELRGTNARLIVAGTGPEEARGRKLAASLGVDANFIGRVAEDDLPGIYRSADVVCAPALGGESFGIVLVEAMAAGTPVVCSDLRAFRAVAGGAAALVPPGDAGALGRAIIDILVDDDRRAEMRRAGKRVAETYDWSRLVNGVEALYEKARTVRRAGEFSE
jgi:phosphatidyl-myo-inositol alpha-mannosyltransferase